MNITNQWNQSILSYIHSPYLFAKNQTKKKKAVRHFAKKRRNPPRGSFYSKLTLAPYSFNSRRILKISWLLVEFWFFSFWMYGVFRGGVHPYIPWKGERKKKNKKQVHVTKKSCANIYFPRWCFFRCTEVVNNWQSLNRLIGYTRRKMEIT